MKRTSNIKYLGYGLIGGIVIAALALGAIFVALSNESARALIQSATLTASPTFMPTFTPTAVITSTPTVTAAPTATFTSTPTLIPLSPTPPNTPIPTATFTLSEQKILSGEVRIAGNLTQEQQINLYNASMTFIALTTKESAKKGEQFAGIGYGSPTLICGPLSIAILQSSGILNFDITPSDFWLLNPFLSKDRAILNRAFPPAQYEHHETLISLREFNFATYPLLPGDFLYIKHGSRGTYDHMLVVNRVDNMGRAYSVTNYETEQGFIINEVMLYDPFDSSAGVFQKWTTIKNPTDSATGLGGFELWRLRAQ